MNKITAFFKSLPGFVHRNASKIGLGCLALAVAITGAPISAPALTPLGVTHIPSLIPWAFAHAAAPYLYTAAAPLGAWSYGKAILNRFGVAQSDSDKIIEAAKTAMTTGASQTVFTAPGQPDVVVIPKPAV